MKSVIVNYIIIIIKTKKLIYLVVVFFWHGFLFLLYTYIQKKTYVRYDIVINFK